jgi:hypothetical protein
MSVIAYPATLIPASMTWGQQRRDVIYSSVFGSQAVEAAAPLWIITIAGTVQKDSTAGQWQSLFLKLRGKVNQLEIFNIVRPVPLGTMRGTMTFNGNHSQGATTISISASGENAKTLLQGDFIGFGTTTTRQMVMVVADATSNGSGIISVTVEPPLRNAFSTGASITWDTPKLSCRVIQKDFIWNYSPGMVSGFSLNLVEDWRA